MVEQKSIEKGVFDTYDNINSIKSSYNVKSSPYEFLNVKKGTENVYYEEGWEKDSELKRVTKLKKLKADWLQLEHKVWCILSKMGFDEINKDSNFKIPISEKNQVNPKQIDVFVKDGNVAIVTECKYSNEIKKKSFRKDISEINGYRAHVIRSIKEHYGQDLKVGWLFVTKNIILNDSDKELADDAKIKIISDDKLDYYNELVKHIGSAAKFQFLAEMFEGQKIPNLCDKVPAICGKVEGVKYYSFSIEPSKLLPRVFVAHRITSEQSMITYQRMLVKSRLTGIRNYIKKTGGLFPNNIIINFNTNKRELRFEPVDKSLQNDNVQLGMLHLPSQYKSAWIIDGQHRIFGFSDTDQIDKVTVPVIAFVDMDETKQANLFVDINSKQKSVPTNLLEDLYSDLYWDSNKESEKISALSSRIVRILNNDLGSPIYKKIKSANQAGTNNIPLTTTTIAVSIKKYKLLGRVENSSNKLYPGILYSYKHPVMDNTLKRASEFLKSYFNIFNEEVSQNWNLGKNEGGYLCTNNGVSSLFIVLSKILKHLEGKTPVAMIDMDIDDLVSNYIKPLILPICKYFNQASSIEIQDFRNKHGPAGQMMCALAMLKTVYDEIPTFTFPELDSYIKNQDETWTIQGRHLVPELQKKISDNIIFKLKENFGENDSGWWYKGVPHTIRTKVVTRQQENQNNKEANFMLLDYKSIVYDNWDLFSETYGIKETKSNEGKGKQLNWFDRLNEIRNTISHPERGKISKDDFIFTEEIDKIITKRLNVINEDEITNIS